MTPEQALTKAKRLMAGSESGFGGNGRLADALGISPAAVSQWRKCPATRVIAVERATEGRVTRHDLRPDLYPEDEPSVAFG